MSIRLEAEDLRRITLRPAGPLLETMFAALALQGPCGRSQRPIWYRHVVSAVSGVGPVLRLLELLPPGPGLVDLGMPVADASTVDEGIDRLNALGPEYFRRELECAATIPGYRPPRWSEQLAAADPRPRRNLVRAFRQLHDAALQDCDEVDLTLGQHSLEDSTTVLAREGLDAMLDNLHPEIRWNPPVLSVNVPGLPTDRIYDGGGRGLTVVPVVLAPGPVLFTDLLAERPSMLVYPITHRVKPSQPANLVGLLGSTRVKVLRSIGAGPRSTSELSRHCGISAASASEHAKALREGA